MAPGPPVAAAAAVAQPAAPVVGAPRSYDSITNRRIQAGVHEAWYERGAARPAAAPAGVLPPTPRSVSDGVPQEGRAGSFTATRDWDTLPGGGPGFIVQHITRGFAGLQIRQGGAWITPTPAQLQTYMGAAAYGQLHYGINDYWEIFPVAANGDPAHNDAFQLVPIIPAPVGARRKYANTSKCTFTQTGTAYFVPCAEALGTFAARFGMRLNGAALANGLYSRTGPYDFPGAIAALGAAFTPSPPSTFALTATWNTDRAASRDDYVKTKITET
jgi:hypothetical protein